MIEEDGESIATELSHEPQKARPPQAPENESLHESQSTRTSVLVLGTETQLFRLDSDARRRAESYATRFKTLDIICFSRRSQQFSVQVLSNDAHVYPTRSRLSILWGFDAARIAFRLPRPDVVTVQDPFETGLLGWCIARLRGSRLHVQVHTDFRASAFRHASLRNRLRASLAGFVLARADRIRLVSSAIKDGIEKAYRLHTPMTVLPIFVDVARFKNVRSGDLSGTFALFEVKLLVVARLEREKNVALALTSFAKVTSKKACLIVVGEGREQKALEKHAERLGVRDRVFFEGKKDPAPYYALADLVLVPSLFEGYGLVIIEALAAGKPVLATDVGIAHEAGAIVTSPENFADALRGWLEGGPREGVLLGYPYVSFDQYADAYCDDVAALPKA